jgi:hypothetical protein
MKSLLFTLIILASFSCTGNEARSTETSPDHSAASLSTKQSEDTFMFAGKAPCDFLSPAAVAEILTVQQNSIVVKSERDKDDHKVCRYEIRDTSNSLSVLTVSINFNKNKEKTPNKMSNRLNEAITSGLPVMGFKDQVQTFKETKGPGTQVAYSGNQPNDKNLLARLGEDYLISIQLNKYLPGQDIGDYNSQLTALLAKIVE